MKLLTALFFAIPFTIAAQSPQVPHKMKFGDITLTIRDDARKEIQQDVDAFTRYQKSFNIKAERAKTYFPIIEKIFAEENVPDDMKYLVIQESALIPDAVSSSNAVGFWQFKDFTAIEMGLRVDREIDERLNIVASSRAAARYLKKNNQFFDNWLYALQAYQMGAGGVMRSVKDTEGGKRHMEITSKTYWYVKKYLAHRIAYEPAVKGPGEVSVITYQTKNKSTLSDLAKELSVEEDALKAYNLWAKSGKIPDDRSYALLIPIIDKSHPVTLPDGADNTVLAGTPSKQIPETARTEDRIKINGIGAIKAREHETPTTIAARAGVELSDFLKYNDLTISDKIYVGQFYLMGKKRNRASQAYHTAHAGDNLWTVSQQYGVKIKRLKKYNRLKSNQDVKPGVTLWLASRKPKDAGQLPTDRDVIEVDKTETFAWAVDPAETTVAVAENGQSGEEAPVVVIAESIKEDTTVVADIEPASPVLYADTVNTAETLQLEIPKNSGQDSLIQSTPEVLPSTKKSHHTVQVKETLYGIAKQYQVGVMDLVTWNELNLQDGIKPGQVLKVSDPQVIIEAKTVQTQEHEVKASDTVYSISRKYGVTIKELMEWNNKKDFTLSVGEKLKILKE